jgi:hypothetical protein
MGYLIDRYCMDVNVLMNILMNGLISDRYCMYFKFCPNSNVEIQCPHNMENLTFSWKKKIGENFQGDGRPPVQGRQGITETDGGTNGAIGEDSRATEEG